MTREARATVVGAGLAGTEAAWQLVRRGVRVRLVEMRPEVTGPAHHTGDFAELVCSNSFKSDDPHKAAGLLKRELGLLGSVILATARSVSVPAGSALAVDRALFSRALTDLLLGQGLLEVERREATSLPSEGVVVVATGPLTSPGLEPALSAVVGADRLAFFDAAAPIVGAGSVDRRIAFAASRYGKGGGDDYLNCPLGAEAYAAFRTALLEADRVERREFESDDLFQACLPIEELARRGEDALRFGPLKPVGLTDPATGEAPHAVVQLRAENASRTAFNLVGCQTNLTFAAQRRVFSMVPGLERAEYLRYGVMHRNTFLDAPRLLAPDLSLRTRPDLFFAGQLTGTEGYLEAAATGLVAGANAHRRLTGLPPLVLPPTTALGSLLGYATDPATEDYQPMHVNFGLVPPLDPPVSGRRRRYPAYSERALRDLRAFLAAHSDFEPLRPEAEPAEGVRRT